MDTFTIVIFLAVTVVMAIAIIALAIWVAVLSHRLKKLFDAVYSDAIRNEPAPLPASQPRSVSPPLVQASSSYSQGALPSQASSRRMAQQSYSAPMRSQSNGAMGDDLDYMGSRDGSAFFDSYAEPDYSNQSAAFGRRKPTIPFGKAKGPAHRYDSYTESAMDSDYDPDSIDFSRVEGYKNFRP